MASLAEKKKALEARVTQLEADKVRVADKLATTKANLDRVNEMIAAAEGTSQNKQA